MINENEPNTHSNIELLTIKEACKILRIKYGTLWLWKKQKKIPFVKNGKFIMFTREAIENYINKCSN